MFFRGPPAAISNQSRRDEFSRSWRRKKGKKNPHVQKGEGGCNCWRRRTGGVVAYSSSSPSPFLCFLRQNLKPPRLQSRGLSVSYRRPTRIPKREQAPPLYWEWLSSSLCRSLGATHCRSFATSTHYFDSDYSLKKKRHWAWNHLQYYYYYPRSAEFKGKIWNSIPAGRSCSVTCCVCVCDCLGIGFFFSGSPSNSELWPNRRTSSAHRLVHGHYSSSLGQNEEETSPSPPPPGRHR